MLVIGVDRPFAHRLEFRSFQHPGQEAGVDTVFHGLRRFECDAAKLAGFVYHLQEQTSGVSHLYAGGVHFRMNNAGFGTDIEFRTVLRVRQAGHAANDGNRPIRANITKDPGLSAQRRIAGFAHHHHFTALAVVHICIAGGRPFDRCDGHIAKPTERLELEIVADLRPHGNGVERKTQHIGGHDCAEKGISVGQRMRDGVDLAVVFAALPDDGVRITGRAHVGGLVEPGEEGLQIATIGFCPRYLH